MAVTNSSHPNQHLPTLSSDHDFSPQPPSADNGNTTAPRPSLPDSSPTSSSLADLADRQSTYKNRQSLSTSSTKANRTGLFTLAALARDKTSSAIASFTDPTIRTRPSSGNLSRQSTNTASSAIPPSP